MAVHCRFVNQSLSPLLASIMNEDLPSFHRQPKIDPFGVGAAAGDVPFEPIAVIAPSSETWSMGNEVQKSGFGKCPTLWCQNYRSRTGASRCASTVMS